MRVTRRFTHALSMAAIAATAAVCACSNNVIDATDPDEPAQVQGKFTGVYTNARAPGSYTATLDLTQEGRTLAGTFVSTDNNSSFTVSGSIDKVRITATFQKAGTCAASSTAIIDVLSNETVLVGTYTMQDCIGQYTGGFSLTKQP